jgi:hypothetical protein
MNPDSELFKKLVKDAGIQLVHWDDSPRLYIENMTYDGNLAKFAELIVQECGNWFNSRLVVEPDYGMEHRIERNRAVVGVMKEFNQHFGVEEPEE